MLVALGLAERAAKPTDAGLARSVSVSLAVESRMIAFLSMADEKLLGNGNDKKPGVSAINSFRLMVTARSVSNHCLIQIPSLASNMRKNYRF